MDYVPQLAEIGKKITKMNEFEVDAQEMDYISELYEYTRYMMMIYDGCDISRPQMMFLYR